MTNWINRDGNSGNTRCSDSLRRGSLQPASEKVRR